MTAIQPAPEVAMAPFLDVESLELIVPVYNEAENFPALLSEVERNVPRPFVMNVVYDFDQDTTVPVARCLRRVGPG